MILRGLAGHSNALAKLLSPSFQFHPDLSMDEGPAFSLACFPILTSSTVGLLFKNLLNRRSVFPENERERPLSG